MKKIYLFFAFVIALAISAKADYYIVGEFTDNNYYYCPLNFFEGR